MFYIFMYAEREHVKDALSMFLFLLLNQLCFFFVRVLKFNIYFPSD